MENNWVFLHGALGIGNLFSSISPFLDAEKMVFLDLPGHGENTSNQAVTIPQYSDWLIDELQKRSIKNPILVGHSMGGYIALYTMIQHPDKIKAVFTLGTILTWTKEVWEKEMALSNPEKMRNKVPQYCQILEKRHTDWELLVESLQNCITDLYQNQYLELELEESVSKRICISLGDSDQTAGVLASIAKHQQWKGSRIQILPCTSHLLEKTDMPLLGASLQLFETYLNL